jgi:hypothetical protein
VERACSGRAWSRSFPESDSLPGKVVLQCDTGYTNTGGDCPEARAGFNTAVSTGRWGCLVGVPALANIFWLSAKFGDYCGLGIPKACSTRARKWWKFVIP